MEPSAEIQKKIEALYRSARELDPAKRGSFLDNACAGDNSLREKVEALLSVHEEVTVTPSPSSIASIDDQSKSQLETPALIGETIAHYKITSFLGRGGMGEVYLAQDMRLNRKVALKLLPSALTHDDERLNRFEREARSASALSHPNVCVIHEIGETTDARAFIAMEYIDGETLRRRFARGPMKLKESIDVARQVASALAAAHEAGVVHRDIKPENIMLRRDGYVKVLDFGLAKLTERYDAPSDSEAPTFQIFSTHSGLLIGTTNYLSPEQARRIHVDERTDIWALGVVLYEMLAGRLPFTGETPSHAIVAILETEPAALAQFLPEVPAELEWIVKKALRKDREERYQTVRELISDLDELKHSVDDIVPERRATAVDSETPIIGHSNAFESISQTLRRPRLSIAFFAGAMALVGIVVLILMHQLRKPGPLAQNLEHTKLTNSGNILDAAISPDGKYVAYVIDELGKQSVWARHVPTAAKIVIAPPEPVRYQGISFSKDSNYIYYTRREKDGMGVLYQVSVLGGATRKLFANIASAVTMSPDGNRFAFVREEPTVRIIAANVNGLDEQELVPQTNAEALVSPAWSPDGSMVVYGAASYSDGYHMTLVTARIDSGQQNIITSRKWYSIKRITWLNDNSGLIVDASDQPYGVFQLWRIAYPGGNAERLTNDLSDYRAVCLTAVADTLVTVQADTAMNLWLIPFGDPTRARKAFSEVGNYFGVSWFPDGRIAFSSMASGNADIWISNADGSGLRQLTASRGANYHPAVSPDGRYIAFTSYRDGIFSIWRMDADGSNQTQLTKGNGTFIPSWSPDGQWIYYDFLSKGNAAIWKIRAEGHSDPMAVTTNGWARGAVVSPDGQFFSCTYWDNQSNSMKYAVMPVNGGTPIKLFGNPDARQRAVRWTADSQALLYVDSQDGNSNIWMQPLNEAPAKQITTYDSDQIFYFDVSRDGRQILLTRGATVSDVVLIQGLK